MYIYSSQHWNELCSKGKKIYNFILIIRKSAIFRLMYMTNTCYYVVLVYQILHAKNGIPFHNDTVKN